MTPPGRGRIREKEMGSTEGLQTGYGKRTTGTPARSLAYEKEQK